MEAGKSRKRPYLFAAAIIIVAASAFAIYGLSFTGNFAAESQAEQNAKDIYGLLTGSEPEVLGVKEESGIYRVVLRTFDSSGASSVQDVFITKDGKLITDKLLNADDYQKSLESSKDFVDCLSGKDVRILGQSTDNYTIAQIQALGEFGYRIYFDCTGNNLQACQRAGIQNIPAVIYNSTIYEGLKPVGWIENLTGCEMER